MKAKTAIKGAIAASAALTALATATVSNFEGRSLKAYYDVVHVLTICDGDTNNVKPGMVETPAGCDRRLQANLVKFERGLDACLHAAVPGKTKVALVSWAFNIGVGAACGSTLVRKANAGDLVGACGELMKWNKGRVGGVLVPIPGLTNRRTKEKALCLDGLRGA